MWEICKQREALLRRLGKKANDGSQRVAILWPREANPAPGWEGNPRNRTEGRLFGHRIELDNGFKMDTPGSGFWYWKE